MSEAELAECQVAQVLAGGAFELVSLVDFKSLLVVLGSFAILAKQLVNSPNIAQRLSLAQWVVDCAEKLEGLLIVGERVLIVPRLVIDQTEVVVR